MVAGMAVGMCSVAAEGRERAPRFTSERVLFPFDPHLRNFHPRLSTMNLFIAIGVDLIFTLARTFAREGRLRVATENAFVVQAVVSVDRVPVRAEDSLSARIYHRVKYVNDVEPAGNDGWGEISRRKR